MILFIKFVYELIKNQSIFNSYRLGSNNFIASNLV